MRRDILELDSSVAQAVATHQARMDLGDVEALRLLLTGGSVIDWHKASFERMASVDRLLELHLFDISEPFDRQRLRYLFHEAVSYVEEYLHLRIPAKLREVDDVRKVFLWASDTTGFRRTQVLSCMVLKLMHVMQHLEAADLRMHVPVAEQTLLDMAHRRVQDASDRMRASGLPLEAFYGSRKTRLAVITKLLCKREDVATRVFDKLRYRVVVPESGDIVPALTWLTRNLVPFNGVVPGQSHNNLIDPEAVPDHLSKTKASEVQPLSQDEADFAALQKNEFSGSSYRMINFVVDVPVRLPLDALDGQPKVSQGRNVYVTVEFQILDEATALANERGENAHADYKKRQHERVRRRLTRGQFVS